MTLFKKLIIFLFYLGAKSKKVKLKKIIKRQISLKRISCLILTFLTIIISICFIEQLYSNFTDEKKVI